MSLSSLSPTDHWLRQYFRSHGITVADLARVLDKSYSHMCDVMAGRARASEALESELLRLKEQIDMEEQG